MAPAASAVKVASSDGYDPDAGALSK